MDKIKAFIEYALEMKQKIIEAQQLENELYLFKFDPHSARLQIKMEKQAEEVGIRSIWNSSDGLIVNLSCEVFHSIGFSNITVTTNCTNGVHWTHFNVVEDEIKFTACQETKNASAYAAPALYAN